MADGYRPQLLGDLAAQPKNKVGSRPLRCCARKCLNTQQSTPLV